MQPYSSHPLQLLFNSDWYVRTYQSYEHHTCLNNTSTTLMSTKLLPWLHLHVKAELIPSLTFHFETQSGSVDGSHLTCSMGQTPAKSSPASPNGEDVGSDSSRKKKQHRESYRYSGPEMNCGSFTGRHSRSQNSGFHFFPRARSAMRLCVCVCAWRRNSHTQSIIYHISHRLTRLSASGSPYYIDGKCSLQDNTHMVGSDERWHPARD